MSDSDDTKVGSESGGEHHGLEHDASPGGPINSPGNTPDAGSEKEQDQERSGRVDPNKTDSP